MKTTTMAMMTWTLRCHRRRRESRCGAGTSPQWRAPYPCSLLRLLSNAHSLLLMSTPAAYRAAAAAAAAAGRLAEGQINGDHRVDHPG